MTDVFYRYRVHSIKKKTQGANISKFKKTIIVQQNIPLPQKWSNFMASPENKSENSNFPYTHLKTTSTI